MTQVVLKQFKFTVFLILVNFSLSMKTQAETPPFVLNNTHKVQMKSEWTGHEHELVIYLPDSYENSPEKHYPVLYFTDAYWDMPLLHSIYGQLTYDNVLPELIMVGFSYPGEDVNYGDLRSRDLSPTRVSAANIKSGQGPEFLTFIEKTVIPYMQSEYRVDAKDRALAGSSMGGLFVLYAMYEKPNLFKRYIAISPAAGWDNRYLFDRDDRYAATHKTLQVRLFLSYGTDEYEPFREPIIALQKKLATRNYDEFALLNFAIEGERHSGVKSEGYSRGLRWIFQNIAPHGPSGLEREIQSGAE
ncbi:MAG: alpha/beta hydrolase-fold protein [candidate division KSB1 bacterium]|nr:alpha/beta hydrolase-fold protein [candidate division KSB1 bacterium]